MFPGIRYGRSRSGSLKRSATTDGVRGRERQHRAERVEVAEEVGLARDQQDPGEHREHDDREPRRAVAWVQLREDARQLAVLGERPRQPRDPDQPRVGGDEQDRRRQDADVVAQTCVTPVREPEVLR